MATTSTSSRPHAYYERTLFSTSTASQVLWKIDGSGFIDAPEYVVTSSRRFDWFCETLVFPANATGRIEGLDILGRVARCGDHLGALRNALYFPVESSIPHRLTDSYPAH